MTRPSTDRIPASALKPGDILWPTHRRVASAQLVGDKVDLVLQPAFKLGAPAPAQFNARTMVSILTRGTT